MKLGLIGPSYQEDSKPFDAQRTINLIPYVNETRNGKEVAALYGTPGLLAFCQCPDGPIRGMFKAGNDRGFVVSNANFYEITAGAGVTARGLLNTAPSNITFADNGLQLAVCDGASLWIFTYATNAWAEAVTTEGAGSVAYLDGYFIIHAPNTGRFYISALYDGLTWDPLDFATAEATPGNLIGVYAAGGYLLLMGRKATEFWYNAGGGDFPFVRQQNGVIKTGIRSAATFAELDNTWFWVGEDKDGHCIVYRANGSNPQRISTTAIEEKLQKATEFDSFKGFTYQQDGHAYYVLTGPGLADTTFAYDAATGLWHERCYLNEEGNFERHLATSCIFAFDKHLVGDRVNGTVYEMSRNYKDDNGREIKAVRVFPHVVNEGLRQRFNEIRVHFEKGVGLQEGQGADPVAMLRMSDDGALTWSNEFQASIGKVGQTKAPCATWNKLGITDTMTLEVSITDPVKRAICGAYAR